MRQNSYFNDSARRTHSSTLGSARVDSLYFQCVAVAERASYSCSFGVAEEMSWSEILCDGDSLRCWGALEISFSESLVLKVRNQGLRSC